MEESNDSFFENVLLKNINENILINIDLSDTLEKTVSTISKTENIDYLKNRKIY